MSFQEQSSRGAMGRRRPQGQAGLRVEFLGVRLGAGVSRSCTDLARCEFSPRPASCLPSAGRPGQVAPPQASARP